jgi:hypothetical protein
MVYMAAFSVTPIQSMFESFAQGETLGIKLTGSRTKINPGAKIGSMTRLR